MNPSLARRPVRVLVDAYCLWHSLTGIRTYGQQICRGFEEATNSDIQVVIVPNWKRLDNSKFFRGELPIYKKALHHLLYFLWKQLVLPVLAIWKEIDVVICPDFVAPAWGGDPRYMPVIHDTFFWERPENYNPIWRRYYTSAIEQGIRREGSVILTTSRYAKRKIESILRPIVPIEVAYQCAGKQDHKTADEVPGYGLKNGNYFLHVGYFDKRKNLPFLVKAYAKYLDLNSGIQMKLVLAGSRGLSPDLDDYDRILAVIDSQQIGDLVVLTGHVAPDQLKRLYSGANAYIFPSLDEGFGIPILEAWHYELPVLVSDRSALPEIGGDAVLTFDPENVDDLVSMMDEVQKKEIRDRLIDKGNTRKLLFTRSGFVGQIEQIIQRHVT